MKERIDRIKENTKRTMYVHSRGKAGVYRQYAIKTNVFSGTEQYKCKKRHTLRRKLNHSLEPQKQKKNKKTRHSSRPTPARRSVVHIIVIAAWLFLTAELCTFEPPVTHSLCPACSWTTNAWASALSVPSTPNECGFTTGVSHPSVVRWA